MGQGSSKNDEKSLILNELGHDGTRSDLDIGEFNLQEPQRVQSSTVGIQVPINGLMKIDQNF